MRRRASLIVLASLPALACLLLAAFPFLTKQQIAGAGALFVVAMLGALLGSVFVWLPNLARLARVRPSDDRLLFGGPLVLLVVVPPLVIGICAAAAEAALLLSAAHPQGYRPQTVYVVAIALTVVMARYAGIKAAVVETTGAGR